MPVLSGTNLIILGWSGTLWILACITGYWAYAFYLRTIQGGDGMAPSWLLLHIAYTNMFICYGVIRAFRVFDLDQSVAILTWGLLSTLAVVGAYALLHAEYSRQRGKR